MEEERPDETQGGECSDARDGQAKPLGVRSLEGHCAVGTQVGVGLAGEP